MPGPPTSALTQLRYARQLGIWITLAAIVAGAVSFAILLNLTPIEPTFLVIISTMVISGIFVAVLAFLVGREVNRLVQARRRGRAAARMHIRIVGLFGVIAALPAVLVAIIAGITLDLALDRLFEQRTKTIVDNSVSVARSYVGEAMLTLQGNSVSMRNFLVNQRVFFDLDRTQFEGLMTGQARFLGLRGALILDRQANILARADVRGPRELPRDTIKLIEDTQTEGAACAAPRTINIAACAIKLTELGGDFYLFTMRPVDPSVLNSIQLMQEITEEYRLLEDRSLLLQLAFALLYVGLCLTILLAAIWMGIAFAERLMAPIRQLIFAADSVRDGNLDVTVPMLRTEGDLRSLSDTFNAMTANLKSQRDEILDNQEQIDARRRFTEAVLAGVSAGVIGISGQGRLAIANASAAELLGDDPDALVGQGLADLSPELAGVIDATEKSGKPQHLEQVVLLREGQERILNVQVTVDSSPENEHSYVITIDDITGLVAAQRTSAWADVARRIAHEIKNPLTPIQLSAERIRRRYGKRITEDREVFDQCTDTIIRQVADIGRMVDEFSSFARMPKPTMVAGDLGQTLREAIFLLKVGNEHITFDFEPPQGGIPATFDSRLLGQAFGNLLKNATEAIEAHDYKEDESPRIVLDVSRQGDFHRIDIIDNGKGLPAENRQRLLEPYMTTRDKGTGLGLAIVSKILEEHGGSIELHDAPSVADGGHGAMMRVLLPASDAGQSATGNEVGDTGTGEEANDAQFVDPPTEHTTKE